MPLLTNNSIAWANLQISGGWTRIAWVAGLIAVGLPLLLFGSTRISLSPESTLAGWFTVMGVAQAVCFGIVIPSRVHGAIKRDRVSKLIESHRLMPESSAAAVAGYILGPNLLLLSCMGVVFVIGAFIANAAKQDLVGWVGVHAAAAGLSAMLCCLVAFSSQWLPKFNPAIFGLVFAPMAANLGSFIPALRVMFAPYTWQLTSLLRGEIRLTHIVAFASQILFAAILFIGATRRYRRDDVAPLGFGWGYVMLAMWVILTCIGTTSERVWALGFNSDQVVGMSYVIGVSLAMLLAVGPIASAATAMSRWRQRRAIDAYDIQPRPISLPAASTLVLALLLCLLLAAPLGVGVLTGFQSTPAFRTPVHLAMTGAQVAVFVLSVALLSHAAGRMKLPAAWLIVPWLVLIWGVLPLTDLLIALMTGQIETFPRGLSSASAPFCLGLIWKDALPQALIGLVTQAALVPLQILFWVAIKRFNAKNPALPTAA